MVGRRASRTPQRQRIRREQLSRARRQHATSRRRARRERQGHRHDSRVRPRRSAGRARVLRGPRQTEGGALPRHDHELGLAGVRPVVARLNVFRWAPDAAATMRAYDVEAGADTTVLDALVAIQREQDPTLALRYACRVGMCGSCAMVINGRERWACRTRLSALGAGPVSVRPLYHFPLLRDLVVDMAPFVERHAAVGVAHRPATDAVAYAEIPAPSAERG